MTLGTILVIILILLLLGVIPNWGYSSGWGYGPSGIVGTILIVVLILLSARQDLSCRSRQQHRCHACDRVMRVASFVPGRCQSKFSSSCAWDGGFAAGTFIPCAR